MAHANCTYCSASFTGGWSSQARSSAAARRTSLSACSVWVGGASGWGLSRYLWHPPGHITQQSRGRRTLLANTLGVLLELLLLLLGGAPAAAASHRTGGGCRRCCCCRCLPTATRTAALSLLLLLGCNCGTSVLEALLGRCVAASPPAAARCRLPRCTRRRQAAAAVSAGGSNMARRAIDSEASCRNVGMHPCQRCNPRHKLSCSGAAVSSIQADEYLNYQWLLGVQCAGNSRNPIIKSHACIPPIRIY